jgi:DNA-binding FadR family transcriptional regulator
MGLVSGETGRGTFVRISRCRRHGVDQQVAGGRRRISTSTILRCRRRDALREALRRLAMAGILTLICATSLMPGGSPSAKLSPAI